MPARSSSQYRALPECPAGPGRYRGC